MLMSITPALFYIDTRKDIDNLIKKAKEKEYDIVKVPLDMKTWSPSTKALIEAYNVFNTLAEGKTIVLAMHEDRHIVDEEEINDILDD